MDQRFDDLIFKGLLLMSVIYHTNQDWVLYFFVVWVGNEESSIKFRHWITNLFGKIQSTFLKMILFSYGVEYFFVQIKFIELMEISIQFCYFIYFPLMNR